MSVIGWRWWGKVVHVNILRMSTSESISHNHKGPGLSSSPTHPGGFYHIYSKLLWHSSDAWCPLLSSECQRHQVPCQKRPPHADPGEETLQVSLWEKLQDLAGPETPHYQLPPTRLHGDPAQDPGLEPATVPTGQPQTKPCYHFANL